MRGKSWSSGAGRRLGAWLRRWLPWLWGERVLVARVLDGDSIRLANGREVRYLGINAPEVYGLNGRPMPWAEAAKAANARLVEGRYVRLVRGEGEPDRDVYGRLLRHVYRGRVWVNGRLVAMGLARVWDGKSADPRLARLQRLETEARRRKRGLWRDAG